MITCVRIPSTSVRIVSHRSHEPFSRVGANRASRMPIAPSQQRPTPATVRHHTHQIIPAHIAQASSLLGHARTVLATAADARLAAATVCIIGTLVLFTWSWMSGRLTQPSTYWKSKAKLPATPVVPPHMPTPRAANDVHDIIHAPAPPDQPDSVPALVAELVQRCVQAATLAHSWCAHRVQQLEATTAQLKDDTNAQVATTTSRLTINISMFDS